MIRGCDRRQYVLEEIPQYYEQRKAFYELVRYCPHIRMPVDSLPKRMMLVVEYLEHNLLRSAWNDELPPISNEACSETDLARLSCAA